MKPNYSPSSNVRVQRGAAGWTGRSCCAVAMPCGGEAPSRQPARSACAHPARRQVTCIFHSLGFITSWNAELARRAARGFASLRVYFRCRVFFCQVRSAAKLVRESTYVWLRFGWADGNRAPLSANAAVRHSTCSPSGTGTVPLISRGRHVCLMLQHVHRGFAGSWPCTGAERRWGRPTPPAGVGAGSHGVPRASARPAVRGSGRSPRLVKRRCSAFPQARPHVALLSASCSRLLLPLALQRRAWQYLHPPAQAYAHACVICAG